MGTGALGSVIVKLATLLGDEYTMLKGVRKDIAFLERELRTMQILVSMLAGMEGLDKLAMGCMGSMRDLGHDMEECIDRFMLRLDEDDMEMEAAPTLPRSTARQLRTMFARHGVGAQIKKLKARVVEEGERRRRLNLDSYVPMTIDPRLAAFHGVAKDLVAIDGPRDEVISLLTEGSVDLKVVAIVGGGGLGKTTLAMEAYRKIGGHFECRASVSVSILDRDKLLRDLLSQIDQADSHNGSRIVVTTRLASVAKSTCSNSGGQLYQMLPLNYIDSRRLFFRRIFHSDNSCPPQLEKISARILRKSGGLPFAIITIAKLLSNKHQTPAEWERVQGSIGAGLSFESDGDGNGTRHISLLGYWDLPHHLKTCLLYLCIYPEGGYISCEEVKWKWILEGFIATKRGNLYHEAESYFNELVNRSMIRLVDVDDDNFEQYCQVHVMVHGLLISLSD